MLTSKQIISGRDDTPGNLYKCICKTFNPSILVLVSNSRDEALKRYAMFHKGFPIRYAKQIIENHGFSTKLEFASCLDNVSLLQVLSLDKDFAARRAALKRIDTIHSLVDLIEGSQCANS